MTLFSTAQHLARDSRRDLRGHMVPIMLAGMVTAGATTYAICGTTTTLGSECDPSADKFCAMGKTCIDGFCR